MNHAVSVDASVGMKWVVAEELRWQALALLQESLRARRPIVVPPHCTGEVTNAIYQRYRTADPAKQLSLSAVEQAVSDFLAYPLEVTTPPDLYREALSFASIHRLPSIYDSLYVVLARQLGVELWTADQRLLNVLGSNAPWVRFIGDYPLA